MHKNLAHQWHALAVPPCVADRHVQCDNRKECMHGVCNQARTVLCNQWKACMHSAVCISTKSSWQDDPQEDAIRSDLLFTSMHEEVPN